VNTSPDLQRASTVNVSKKRSAGHVLTTRREARTLFSNPDLQIYPGAGMTCVFDPQRAACRIDRDDADTRRTPDLSDCRAHCANIARTDRDIDALRDQAAQLAEVANDAIAPEPRTVRYRHELGRLRTLIDEHAHGKPTPMADSDAERAAIRAAMQRLLDGTPKRSTGALSVLQLAAEAGMKRWLLTHKHTDLADEFRNRVQAPGPIPSAYSNLDQQARDAQDANQELRAQNTQLRAQVTVYARIIHELHTALANAPAPRLSVVKQRDNHG
jgi:hypothetical protein